MLRRTTTSIAMQPSADHSGIFALPVEERLDLAQRLWDSVRDEIEALPLTAAQRAEIERRVAEIDAGAVHCEPFDAVMKRLLAE
ncbi:MAG: addiction module protein [Phycisphaerae bacterium]|nr:MAG: addiction module protein [Phycisphaerae bacterium]MBE7457821.1 addiction module protein [Planctomycetia bacterium]MCL4720217.1 addiction module protein [Phycisphaerae bacterium]